MKPYLLPLILVAGVSVLLAADGVLQPSASLNPARASETSVKRPLVTLANAAFSPVTYMLWTNTRVSYQAPRKTSTGREEPSVALRTDRSRTFAVVHATNQLRLAKAPLWLTNAVAVSNAQLRLAAPNTAARPLPPTGLRVVSVGE